MAGFIQTGMQNGGTQRPRGGATGRWLEINVTPLVDVMLVLLIIFMVTAPLMTSGVTVDLPKTTAQPVNQDSEPVTVSVDAQGKIFLQDTEVPLPDLVAQAAGDRAEQPGRGASSCAATRRCRTAGSWR